MKTGTTSYPILDEGRDSEEMDVVKDLISPMLCLETHTDEEEYTYEDTLLPISIALQVNPETTIVVLAVHSLHKIFFKISCHSPFTATGENMFNPPKINLFTTFRNKMSQENETITVVCSVQLSS